MNIFLTGGTGFIGSYVLKILLEQGGQIRALRFEGTKPHLKIDKPVEWIDGTLDADYDTILGGIDVVIHLAAYGVNPAQDIWSEAIYWNVTCLEKMLQSGLRNGVRRFVLAGSCFEYGLSAQNYERIPVDAPLLPNKPYDASKAAATILAQAFARQNNLELAVLRPFQLFGEGESPNRLWPALKQAALEGEDFDMTPGDQLRDFIPVETVAEAFVQFATTKEIEKGIPVTRNLGTGNATSIAEFSKFWWCEWNARGNLNIGKLPYRANEVMRYVPEV